MADIYRYWNSETALEKYSKVRPWSGRFRSEVFFLEKIMKPGMSVLDIGCATGDLYPALKERYGSVNYTGIDVAPAMIAKAKTLLSSVCDATFIEGNILDIETLPRGSRFDIVTATGVFQHEFHYRELLRAMVDHTKEGGHILFDVKLFHSHPTLCDITRAWVDHPDPIYFIVFNFKDLLNTVLEESGVGNQVEVFGYYSGVHPSVRLMPAVSEKVCSAHVLLRRDNGTHNRQQMKLKMNLPGEFITPKF